MEQVPSNWKERANALLRSVADVESADGVVRQRESSLPSQAHSALYGKYKAELRLAKQGAELWWKALIESEQRRGFDLDRAIRNVRLRWPVGPVAHKFVIKTVRQFWLECDVLNSRVAELERIPPEDLVLGWLIQGKDADLAEFLSQLPFWPLGLDLDGKWV